MGDRGSVIVPRANGADDDWENRGPIPDGKELISFVAFDKSGAVGLIAGWGGLLQFTTNRGQTWKSPDVSMREDERVVFAVFRDDGTEGFLVGSQGLVAVTADKGETWNDQRLLFKDQEHVLMTVFSLSGTTGLIRGNEGSAYLAGDGARIWKPLDFPGQIIERIIYAVFGADGRLGFIMDQEGSVFVTTDAGQSWEITDRIDSERRFVRMMGVWPSRATASAKAFAIDSWGGIYHLQAYPSLEDWETMDTIKNWKRDGEDNPFAQQ